MIINLCSSHSNVYDGMWYIPLTEIVEDIALLIVEYLPEEICDYVVLQLAIGNLTRQGGLYRSLYVRAYETKLELETTPYHGSEHLNKLLLIFPRGAFTPKLRINVSRREASNLEHICDLIKAKRDLELLVKVEYDGFENFCRYSKAMAPCVSELSMDMYYKAPTGLAQRAFDALPMFNHLRKLLVHYICLEDDTMPSYIESLTLSPTRKVIRDLPKSLSRLSFSLKLATTDLKSLRNLKRLDIKFTGNSSQIVTVPTQLEMLQLSNVGVKTLNDLNFRDLAALTCLTFYCLRDSVHITNLDCFPSLQKLTLYESQISFGTLPLSLIYLEISSEDMTTQELCQIELPENLQALSLRVPKVESLVNVEFPNSLREFKSTDINVSSLAGIVFPPQLGRLRLSSSVRLQLEGATLPDSVHSLFLGNADLQLFDFPRLLKRLVIVKGHNLQSAQFPIFLQSLTIRESSVPTDETTFPEKLAYLLLCHNELQNINKLKLPPFLEALDISQNEQLSFHRLKLPRTLHMLKVDSRQLERMVKGFQLCFLKALQVMSRHKKKYWRVYQQPPTTFKAIDCTTGPGRVSLSTMAAGGHEVFIMEDYASTE